MGLIRQAMSDGSDKVCAVAVIVYRHNTVTITISIQNGVV